MKTTSADRTYIDYWQDYRTQEPLRDSSLGRPLFCDDQSRGGASEFLRDSPGSANLIYPERKASTASTV